MTLASGAQMVTVKSSSSSSLLDQHNVNVKVQYDERPIGGILNVQVSMTPAFAGVGVSTRPIISRSVAQAVDEFTEASVQTIVRELTSQIQSEFAAN